MTELQERIVESAQEIIDRLKSHMSYEIIVIDHGEKSLKKLDLSTKEDLLARAKYMIFLINKL